MKPTQFDEIVKKRADERVQKKIKACKRAVANAVRAIYGNTVGNYHDSVHDALQDKQGAPIMAVLSSDTPSKGWPKDLWEREREAVAAELLATMDEMQKALLAPAPDTTAEDYNHEDETAPDQ